jgi:hypothetical protein
VVLGHPNLADVPDTAETRLDAAGWGRAKERRTPRGFGRLAEEGLHDGLRIASPKMMKKVPAPHPSPRQTSAISSEHAIVGARADISARVLGFDRGTSFQLSAS